MKEKSELKRFNWATELNVHDEEESSKILSKAKAAERKLMDEQNYRWYNITPTYRILIPFDAESNMPTQEGLMKIQKHKEMLNIV